MNTGHTQDPSNYKMFAEVINTPVKLSEVHYERYVGLELQSKFVLIPVLIKCKRKMNRVSLLALRVVRSLNCICKTALEPQEYITSAFH